MKEHRSRLFSNIVVFTVKIKYSQNTCAQRRGVLFYKFSFLLCFEEHQPITLVMFYPGHRAPQRDYQVTSSASQVPSDIIT